MDFNPENFRKVDYDTQSIFFDKSCRFHEYFKHKQKTKKFPFYRNILKFLEENLNLKIYFTLSEEIETFQKVNGGFLLKMPAYLNFCRTIASKTGGRLKAFLGQNVSIQNVSVTEEEKAEFIRANASEVNIINAVNSLKPEIKENILKKLSSQNEVEVVEKDKLIIVNDHNKKEILEQIINNNYSEEFWNLLSSKEPEFSDKLSAARLQTQRRIIIDELKNRLENNTFAETAGDNSWQKWIYKHNWLFGINYQKPIEKQKINIDGIMPDFSFPTLDGFVDILEIKLPSFDIIVGDQDHPGSWVWGKETNCAIGQVVNYLCEIDRQRYEIEKKFEKVYGKPILILRPRAFILIGQNDDWDISKKEGLRKLNYSLHGIEVLTYTDLLKRGEGFINSNMDNL